MPGKDEEVFIEGEKLERQFEAKGIAWPKISTRLAHRLPGGWRINSTLTWFPGDQERNLKGEFWRWQPPEAPLDHSQCFEFREHTWVLLILSLRCMVARHCRGSMSSTCFSKFKTMKSISSQLINPHPHLPVLYLPHLAIILILYCQSLHFSSKSMPLLFLRDDKFFCIKVEK